MGGRGEGGEKANGKSQCTNLDLRSTRNGNDVVTLTKNPCEANLPSTRISSRPNLFQPVRKFEDIREVFLREPSRQILKDLSAIYIYIRTQSRVSQNDILSVLGYGAPKIIRGEVVERFILACKQSASHR